MDGMSGTEEDSVFEPEVGEEEVDEEEDGDTYFRTEHVCIQTIHTWALALASGE